MYEYPLEKYGSRYIMLYSGFIEERGIRCVWLAHSKDAEKWVQLKTPLVEPVEGEMNDCYGPSLFRWKGKNYVVYQDHTTWRGGNIKYVELDQELNPVGGGGKRYVLLDPPDEPPLNNRYRGAEFYFENGNIYLYSSASKNPRLIVYATAEFDEPVHNELESLSQSSDNGPVSIRFGNYARGEINCYHISYSATDEQGVPRKATHLKIDGKDVERRNWPTGWLPLTARRGNPSAYDWRN